MDEDNVEVERLKDLQAQWISKETGITEAQARELVDMIGIDRPSLPREARALKSRPKPPINR
ncbi:hypothetical protein NMG46_29185 [Mesorhizobium sp. LMG 17147]|uniref:hypothetical protein n=1 Tax=Mesorhizobium sp. LMG 17147 TaxID=2963091 RepID=UPI0020C94AF4|nr:hypothetical protein [Mesorhizobium sp. LMG 17147]MCP9234220.1 hypothetical protein [Mesorhizobium sp. LMG 17147]